MKFLTTCTLTVLWITVVCCHPIPLPVRPQRISRNEIDGLQDNVEQNGIHGRWLSSNLDLEANIVRATVANRIAASPSPSIAVKEKQRDMYDLLQRYNEEASIQLHDAVEDKPFSFTEEDSMMTTDDPTKIYALFNRRKWTKIGVTTESATPTYTEARKTTVLIPATTTRVTNTESVIVAMTPTLAATRSTPGILAKSVTVTAKPVARTPTTTARPRDRCTLPHQQPRRRLPRIGVKFWSRKQPQLPNANHGEIFKET